MAGIPIFLANYSGNSFPGGRALLSIEWLNPLINCLPPDIRPWAAGFIIFAVTFLILAVGIRILKGSGISLFGILKAEEHSKPFHKLKAEHSELNAKHETLIQQFNTLTISSRQTNVVVKLLFHAIRDIRRASWNNIDEEHPEIDAKERIEQAKELALQAIYSALSHGKDHFNKIGVFLPTGDGNQLRVAWCKNYSPEGKLKLRLDLGSKEKPGSTAAKSWFSCKQIYAPDVNKEESFRPNAQASNPYKSLVCTPILAGEKCLGILTVDDAEEGAFSQADLQFMNVFAELISMILLSERLETLRAGRIREGGGQCLGNRKKLKA